MALNSQWRVHSKIGVQDAAFRVNPLPRPKANLENVGAIENQKFSMARLQA
jgi:hypothetical protein